MLVSRGTTTLPTPVSDAAFRWSRGNKVTAESNREERASYQARIEDQE
ncbi:hypothetical protein [Mycobacterium asiaticum]|nr:hypothetical protein [Mycobacterium asiaticum]